jgi:hypothetical protein
VSHNLTDALCGPSMVHACAWAPPSKPFALTRPCVSVYPYLSLSVCIAELERQFGEMPFWYAHKTDLYRLWILERFGGAYLDTDVILQKPINRDTLSRNVLGLESGSLQVEKSHEPVVVNCACADTYACTHTCTQEGRGSPKGGGGGGRWSVACRQRRS